MYRNIFAKLLPMFNLISIVSLKVRHYTLNGLDFAQCYKCEAIYSQRYKLLGGFQHG